MKKIVPLLILMCSFFLIDQLHAQAPVITSFSPASCPIGSVVTITGSNFNSTAAQNVVFFGQVKANVNSATANQLKVTVPAGASCQPLSVANLSNQLTGYSAKAFVPTFTSKNNISPSDFDTTVAVASLSIITGIVFADIDGDGKPDMVVLNNNNNTSNASVYRNISSTGTINATSFDAKVDFYAGQGPIILQDVNGDGKPDMLVLDKVPGSIICYMNTAVPGTIDANSFQPQTSLYPGGLAIGIKLADIDGDGKPDIIVINSDTTFQAIVIYKNTSSAGTLSFVNSTSFRTGHVPACITTGDIDGDGKPDIIIGNTDNTLIVYQNNSTSGNISLSNQIAFGQSAFYMSNLTMADIDGDGKADLVVGNNPNGNTESQQISIYRNKSTSNIISTASFAVETDIAVDQASEQIEIADMDGDGKPDLVVQGQGGISILRNSSSPGIISFSTKADVVPTPIDETIKILGIGDVDGDGRPDIIFSNPYNNYNILALHNNPLPASVTVAAPTITGFTPAAGMVGSTAIISGTNLGTTPATTTVTIGSETAKIISLTSTRLSVQIPAGEIYAPLTVTNTATGLGSNSINCFVNTFKGSKPIDTSVLKYQSSIPNANLPKVIAVGDLDGDGKPDLVYDDVSTNGPIISVCPNSTLSAGNIQFKLKTDYVSQYGVNTILLIDIDGDSKPDIVESAYANTTGNLLVYLNTSTVGNISFAPPVIFPYLFNCMAPGDLNGDGKIDIAGITGMQGENHNLIVLQNTSTPGKVSFSPPVSFGVDILSTVMAIRDLDGDNLPDMVVAEGTDNALRIFRNISSNGGISFAGGIDFSTSGSDILNIGDIDMDGKPDLLAAQHMNNTTVSILRNTSSPGKISFAAKQDITAGDNIYDMAISDINGDGKVDIATVNGPSANTTVCQNNSAPGNISFGTKIVFTQTGPSPIHLNFADLDGDGKPDAAIIYGGITQNSANYGGVSIINNLIPSIPLPVITANGPLSFISGDSVLLTANPDTGYTYQWQKNGIAIIGATMSTIMVKDSGAYSVTLTLAAQSKTSAAVHVNTIFVLPADNFLITTTSATCKGVSDGLIKVSAQQPLPYTLTVTSSGLNSVKTFTDSVTVNNLAAGSYTACITVAQHTNYQQCYDLIITEPKDLSVYSFVNNSNNTVTLSLNGGAQYDINLNGQDHKTVGNTITLPLNDGENDLLVTTDKLCQGTFQKTISLPQKMTPYPVPFQNLLNINIGSTVIASAIIKIYTLADGKMIYSNQYLNISGVLQLDVSSLNDGAYFMKVTLDNTEKVFKILKK